MQITNPRFLLARRRAARYGLGLDVPAYVRKHLEPRVQIGILRDPAKPIEIQPAIHTPASSKLLRALVATHKAAIRTPKSSTDRSRKGDGLIVAIVLMGFGLVAFGVI